MGAICGKANKKNKERENGYLKYRLESRDINEPPINNVTFGSPGIEKPKTIELKLPESELVDIEPTPPIHVPCSSRGSVLHSKHSSPLLKQVDKTLFTMNVDSTENKVLSMEEKLDRNHENNEVFWKPVWLENVFVNSITEVTARMDELSTRHEWDSALKRLGTPLRATDFGTLRDLSKFSEEQTRILFSEVEVL
jgi:hypothetical protein